MLIFRNRLIFGLIRKTVTALFRAVYSVIAFLNLQTALLVAVIGAILFLTGVLDNPTILLIFRILLILSIVLAIVKCVKKLLGLENKKHTRGGGAQVIKTSQMENLNNSAVIQPQNQNAYQYSAQNVNADNSHLNGQTYSQLIKSSNLPKYFRVKQNPNYVMAEYEDRYELYKLSEKGMERVRTDYK